MRAVVRCETFGQRGMVRLAPHRDDRLNPGSGAGVHVAFAEIAVVSKQLANLAQFDRQFCDLAQHRLKLLLVVGACTTSTATTSRLSAATAAWAL